MNIAIKFFIAGLSGIFIGKTIYDKFDFKKNSSNSSSNKEVKKLVMKKDVSCQTELNNDEINKLLTYKKDIDDIYNNKYEWKLV